MHVQVIYVLEPKVEMGRIYPTNAREVQIATFIDPDHARAAILVHSYELADPPHVALAIDLPAALKSERVDILQVEHIADLSWLAKGEAVMVFG